MQSNYVGSTHKKEYGDNKLLSYDHLNPEHEDTGWVLWRQLDNMYTYFSFHSGAQTLESYEINKLLRFGVSDYLRHTARLFATR
jgi:hypothetical protein